MKIGEHRMREHVRLLFPLFGFIAAVFALRLIMAAADTPAWLTRLVSVTTATSLSVLLAVLLIHLRRFGSYTTVVVTSLLLNAWSEGLIAIAILSSALTHRVNIYTAPEYSMRDNGPYHLWHIYGHLTYGIGTGTLTGAATGCLFLWLLRTFMQSKSE